MEHMNMFYRRVCIYGTYEYVLQDSIYGTYEYILKESIFGTYEYVLQVRTY